MKVTFEDEVRDLDWEHMRLRHAREIQRFTGLSIGAWAKSLEIPAGEDGVREEPPPQWLESLAALYWLMLAQNSDDPPAVADVDFDVNGFYLAFLRARLAEIMAARAAKEKAAEPDPTSPPPGPRAAGTGSRARSSRKATTRKPPAQQEPEGESTG